MVLSFPFLVEFQTSFSAKNHIPNLSKLLMNTPVKFINVIKVKLAGLRYRFKLAVLREIDIYRTLLENYDRIPRKSMTYLFVTLVKRSAKMKNLLLKIERGTRKSFIYNI